MTQSSLSDLFWLVSRAAGVLAIVLVSISVLLGLAMAARVLRDPGRRRAAVSIHQDLALISLVAVAIHGAALLGDTWLRPGIAGVTVPFLMPYRPGFTGIGVIAGYLMLLLGPSFYLRRRIGAKRWRSLHRLTFLIWPMAAVHTLGSGTDAKQLWLRVIVLLPAPALAYLAVARLARGRTAAGPARVRDQLQERGEHPTVAAPAQRRRGGAQPQLSMSLEPGAGG